MTNNDARGQTVADYDYDASGNRDAWTAPSSGSTTTTVQCNGLLEDNPYTYAYDAEGHLTTKIKKVSGQPVGQTTLYQWDNRNRLVKITEKPSPNSGTSTKVALCAGLLTPHSRLTEGLHLGPHGSQFGRPSVGVVGEVRRPAPSAAVYEEYNQWIGRIVDPDGTQGPAPLEKTFFAYDRGQIVLQFNGSGAANLTNRYLWGAAVDQILAEEAHVKQRINNPTCDQPGTTFWPLVDHLGSVRDLVQVYGYPAGSGLPAQQTQLVKHREYDSYSNRLSEWNRADFNSDGRVGDADIDLLRDAINAGSTDLYYDLNGKGLVDRDPNSFNDMDELILIILNTYYGDANLDGVFDSGDQALVFQSGEYEDGIPNNSGWAEGDWNGDGDFDSGDFTYVFNKGGYEPSNKGGGAYEVHQILLGFTARPFDDETGLQNNLNRWYDPRIGRWLSEDPTKFNAGDANLYRYVWNSATRDRRCRLSGIIWRAEAER